MRRVDPCLATRLAFAGVATQISWATMGVGFLLFAVFVRNADTSWMWVLTGELDESAAEVVDVRETARTSTYLVRYRWVTPEGIALEAASYVDRKPAVGDPSKIWFARARHTSSRIIEGRDGLYPAWCSVLALVPLVGFLGVRRRMKHGHTLVRDLTRADEVPAELPDIGSISVEDGVVRASAPRRCWSLLVLPIGVFLGGAGLVVWPLGQ